MKRPTLLACVVTGLSMPACVGSERSDNVMQVASVSQLRRPAACPCCGGEDILPIIFGRLAPSSQREVDGGGAVAGGCTISPDSPDWACRRCGHRWFDAEDPHRKALWAALDREAQELEDRHRSAKKPPN